jgi:hypothetical protein
MEQNLYPSPHSSRNEIESESFPGHSDTRMIEGKQERETSGWQQPVACVQREPQCATSTQQSGVFRPKGNEESFLSCLFSETIIV